MRAAVWLLTSLLLLPASRRTLPYFPLSPSSACSCQPPSPPTHLHHNTFHPSHNVTGVILLQMLTGLEASRVVAVVEAALARSQHDAASFATIIDPRSGSWPITEAASFAHLAVRCVALQRSQRPDLRGEVLPALLQLAERSKLYSSGASVKRSLSISNSSSTPPSMMICPITQDVMEDPVFAADGYT